MQGRFAEAEANEILRIAVRESALPNVSREELALAAAQLGISEEALTAAEEQFANSTELELDLQEFRRLRFRSWRNRSIGFGLYSFLMLFSLYQLGGGYWLVPFFLAMFAVQTYRMLSPRTREFKTSFSDWRKLKSMKSLPTATERVVSAVASGPSPRGAFGRLVLIARVARALHCDWFRARQAINDYSSRYPDEFRGGKF